MSITQIKKKNISSINESPCFIVLIFQDVSEEWLHAPYWPVQSPAPVLQSPLGVGQRSRPLGGGQRPVQQQTRWLLQEGVRQEGGISERLLRGLRDWKTANPSQLPRQKNLSIITNVAQ